MRECFLYFKLRVCLKLKYVWCCVFSVFYFDLFNIPTVILFVKNNLVSLAHHKVTKITSLFIFLCVCNVILYESNKRWCSHRNTLTLPSYLEFSRSLHGLILSSFMRLLSSENQMLAVSVSVCLCLCFTWRLNKKAIINMFLFVLHLHCFTLHLHLHVCKCKCAVMKYNMASKLV